MITGIVKSDKCSPESKQVHWTIDNFNEKLEKNDILQSDPFLFAGQKWRLLLTVVDILEAVNINVSLSRVTVSNEETSFSQFVCWNVGILDRNGASHFVRSGFAGLEMVCRDWISVADWPGPELTYLCMGKELYMPHNKFTVSIHLRLDSGCALTTEEQDLLPKVLGCRDTVSDFVVIRVREKTFYVRLSNLETVMSVQKWIGEINIINLPDCDPEAFGFFLSFANSGELEGLTKDITEKVYFIADKLDVPKLKKECVRHLLRTLDVSSVCDILKVAERHRDEELKTKATEFFMKNIREILHTSKWLELMAKQTMLANDLILSYFEKTH